MSKRSWSMVALACVLLPVAAAAQMSNEAYYNQQQAIQRQQHAAEMNRLGYEAQQRAYREAAQSQQAPAQAPGYAYAAAAAPTYYVGFSTDDAKRQTLHISTYHLSGEEAQQRALDKCEAANPGGKCLDLGWSSNTCMAFTRSLDGGVFSAHDASSSEAARKAMAACNKDTLAGKCRLMSLPVCDGSRYGKNDAKDAVAASKAEIEGLSARMDAREYWGAIAFDDKVGFMYADDYPARKDAVDAIVGADDCKACKLVLTYQDSCVGLAWVKDESLAPTYTHVAGAEPGPTRDAARDQCAKDSGHACKARVRCTGRRFMDGYPGSGKAE